MPTRTHVTDSARTEEALILADPYRVPGTPLGLRRGVSTLAALFHGELMRRTRRLRRFLKLAVRWTWPAMIADLWLSLATD
jgi:hypothetical protein